MDQTNKSSNRSFGVVFFIVFLIISLYPILNYGEIRLWALIISSIFLILGLVNSKLLSPLNNLWFRFGIFLGKIISPIIMGIIFFLVVTPIGFLMRILGKIRFMKQFHKPVLCYKLYLHPQENKQLY